MDDLNSGSGLFLFAIIALLGLSGGGFGGWGAQRAASVEDINNSANFTRLEAQVRDNANLTERKADAISNGICSLGYEMANKFAQTERQIFEGNQKIIDLITGNRMADMQGQINQLQLQAALCGVVRYPTGMTYTAGASPFCNCGFNGSY